MLKIQENYFRTLPFNFNPRTPFKTTATLTKDLLIHTHKQLMCPIFEELYSGRWRTWRNQIFTEAPTGNESCEQWVCFLQLLRTSMGSCEVQRWSCKVQKEYGNLELKWVVAFREAARSAVLISVYLLSEYSTWQRSWWPLPMHQGSAKQWRENKTSKEAECEGLHGACAVMSWTSSSMCCTVATPSPGGYS